MDLHDVGMDRVGLRVVRVVAVRVVDRAVVLLLRFEYYLYCLELK